MLQRIKFKAFSVSFMVHLGLAFSVFGALNPEYKQFLFTGIALSYLGFVVGSLFLYVPVAPWLKRINKVFAWRSWVIQELPTIIAMVPVLIGIAAVLKSSYEELKKLHKEGKLDLEQFSKISRKVADAAETKYAETKKVVQENKRVA